MSALDPHQVLSLAPTFLTARAAARLMSGGNVGLPAGCTENTRCNIYGPAGRVWRECTIKDALRLIDIWRTDPEKYPEWQGDLAVEPFLPIRPRQRQVACGALTYSDGLPPLSSAAGVEQLLRMTGTTIGLGDDDVVFVECGSWSNYITLELALANLDRFIEPSNARLVELIGFRFGVDLDRKRA